MGSLDGLEPLDLVYFFFNLKGLEIIKLCVVALELGHELVLAMLGVVALKEDHAAAPVAGGEVAARVVELDGGDDVRLGHDDVSLVAETLIELEVKVVERHRDWPRK